MYNKIMKGEAQLGGTEQNEKQRRGSTVDFLVSAAIMFDDCQALYEETDEAKLLWAKSWLFEKIIVECENCCEDWDTHKDPVTNRLKYLTIEMNNISQQFVNKKTIARIGYGHNGYRNNVFYELVEGCLCRDGMDKTHIDESVKSLVDKE
jgi:hypothetical protein